MLDTVDHAIDHIRAARNTIIDPNDNFRNVIDCIALLEDADTQLFELQWERERFGVGGPLLRRLENWCDRIEDKVSVYGLEKLTGEISRHGRSVIPGYAPNRETLETIQMKRGVLSAWITELCKDPAYYSELMENTAGHANADTATLLFSAGKIYDAANLISKLFSEAQNSIIVIDGYLGDRGRNLLTSKARTVVVKVLTKPSKDKREIQLFSDFNTQYKNLSLRESNQFHDRFIIIDNKDFYICGASLKDLGNKTFAFLKIEDSACIAAITNEFNSAWQSATVVL